MFITKRIKHPMVVSLQEARILDMYAYVIDTGEVIDSGRQAWGDVGTSEYREATGE